MFSSYLYRMLSFFGSVSDLCAMGYLFSRKKLNAFHFYFFSRYGSMASYADHLFPPTDANYSPSMALEFSSFTYWRDILPTITDNNDSSDQTDGGGVSATTTTTAAIEINVDETDNANQANISAEAPASDHGGQVTNQQPI